MSWLFPRGTRRMPPVWVDDVPENVKVETTNDFVKESLNRPLDYTGGFKMQWEKEELLKDLIKKGVNDELIPEILSPTLWDQMVNEIKENTAERKRRLMRLEKEMLVDMVFNLENRNETLVNNLLELERMYNDLKGEQ